MKDCLLSIVTISKNHRQGLLETLESVRKQDYQHIEHIVIDSDSNDGTKELLANYAHSKTYSYCSEPDRGISDAFNKGLERSQGHLIFFLNAGDVLFSSSIISNVVASYQEKQWKCAQGGVTAPSLSGREVIYMPPKLPSRFLNYFMFLPHQGFFCETALHQQYRFDESIKTSMDYDVFIRMLPGVEICYLPWLITKSEPGGGVASNWKLRVIEQGEIRMRHINQVLDRAIVPYTNRLIYLKNFLKIGSPFSKLWKAEDAS